MINLKHYDLYKLILIHIPPQFFEFSLNSHTNIRIQIYILCNVEWNERNRS